MAHRHRGVARQQQHSHRLSQDGAAPDHDGVPTVGVDVVGVEQPHDPGRRAGGETTERERHPGKRERGDAIDVLVGRDRVERRTLVDVRRDGMLQQDAVHARIVRQLDDRIDQRPGHDRCGRTSSLRRQPNWPSAALSGVATKSSNWVRSQLVTQPEGGPASRWTTL
jgi:hypothetical protein